MINRYVGKLAPMTGVFPDLPAPVIRNTDNGTEMTLMRWGMPPPPRARDRLLAQSSFAAINSIRETSRCCSVWSLILL